MTIVYLLKTWSEVSQRVREALATIQKHTGRQAAKVSCDNANKYLTKAILAEIGERAITVSPTTPHTPQEIP